MKSRNRGKVCGTLVGVMLMGACSNPDSLTPPTDNGENTIQTGGDTSVTVTPSGGSVGTGGALNTGGSMTADPTGGTTSSSTATATGGITASTGGSTTATGGRFATGGATVGNGGTTNGGRSGSTGGASSATGGSTAAGGATIVAGGATATGGATVAGGATATGGATVAGGATATGGASTSAGGVTATGGASAVLGGATATGGATSTVVGGASSATGGATTAGGASSTEATGGTSSTPPPTGPCVNVVGATDVQGGSSLKLYIQVLNKAATTVDMSTVSLRYWYQDDGWGTPTLSMNADYISIGYSNTGTVKLDGVFAASPAVAGADHYIQLSFTGTLAATGDKDSKDIFNVHVQLHLPNYSGTEDVTNDYSYTGAIGLDNKITLHAGTTLIWGIAPG